MCVLLDIGYGLVTAAILALSAVAFTLEYAVSRVANLAHGEILTVGAYTAFFVQRSTGNVLLAALGAAAAGAVAGYATNLFLIERFSRRPILVTFIATLGLSLMLQNLMTTFFRGFQPGVYDQSGRAASVRAVSVHAGRASGDRLRGDDCGVVVLAVAAYEVR